MSEATTGVAGGERLDEHHPEALPAERRRDEELGGRELARPHVVGDDPEHVDPVLVEPQPRLQEPVLQRVGTDQPEPRPGRSPDLRPGAQEHRQSLPCVVAADEDDLVLASLGVGVLGDDDAVRDDLEARAEPALGRLGRHPRDGDPGVDPVDQEPPDRDRRAHPAEFARRMPRRDDRAPRARERDTYR